VSHLSHSFEGLNLSNSANASTGSTWRLTQKARDRGYGVRADQENFTPLDPEAEAKRAEAVRLIGAIIEERARLGLPPLFPRQASPKLLEITDPTATRRAGDDGTRVLPRR
jgi:hypothetical protein